MHMQASSAKNTNVQRGIARFFVCSVSKNCRAVTRQTKVLGLNRAYVERRMSCIAESGGVGGKRERGVIPRRDPTAGLDGISKAQPIDV